MCLPDKVSVNIESAINLEHNWTTSRAIKFNYKLHDITCKLRYQDMSRYPDHFNDFKLVH